MALFMRRAHAIQIHPEMAPLPLRELLSSINNYKRIFAIGLFSVVTACSSGGNGDVANTLVTPTTTPTPTNNSPRWTPGVYSPTSNYAKRCVTPKSGINPFTEAPYGHVAGTAMHEKLWLRSMSNDLYLWYNQLPDPDPTPYSVDAYFDVLKIESDKFHYATPVEDYFGSSETGVYVDNGIRWHLVDAMNFVLRVADLDGNYNLGGLLNRGDTLLEVDGITLRAGMTQSEFDAAIDGLSPSEDDPTHVFTLRDKNTQAEKTVMLTARALEHNPVPRHGIFDNNGTKFGYIQFDDHNAISEQPLINIINEFDTNSIDELILDIRYNGGGYLYIASELSYMLAGAMATSGKAFITPKFNDKHKTIDPTSGAPIKSFPFFSDGGTGPTPVALPSLNLNRIYVLTSDQTCSASEAIMNGLKGVGVEVVQIGGATCGKPYAFQPQENCGILYSTVLFSNENAAGFGDYADGFSPTNGTQTPTQSVLPGCDGEDDVDHALGTKEEGLIAAALYWHDNQECPPASALKTGQKLHSKSFANNPLWSTTIAKQPEWKKNAYLDPKERRKSD